MAEAEADVVKFMQQTLFAVQSKSLNVNVADVTRTSLQRLVDDGLVTRKRQANDICKLDVTHLGKAVYKGKCCGAILFVKLTDILIAVNHTTDCALYIDFQSLFLCISFEQLEIFHVVQCHCIILSGLCCQT